MRDEICKHCGVPTKFGANSPVCDHLYYPDNCDVCQKGENNTQDYKLTLNLEDVNNLDNKLLDMKNGEYSIIDIRMAITEAVSSIIDQHDQELVEKLESAKRPWRGRTRYPDAYTWWDKGINRAIELIKGKV